MLIIEMSPINWGNMVVVVDQFRTKKNWTSLVYDSTPYWNYPVGGSISMPRLAEPRLAAPYPTPIRAQTSQTAILALPCQAPRRAVPSLALPYPTVP